MNKNRIGRQVLAVVLLFVGSLAGVGSVQAALSPNTGLFLNLADEPDIGTTGITVTYDAGTGAFSATGYSSTIRTGGADHSFDTPGFGPFTLNASIDQTTGDALGGSLLIGGKVSGLGFNSGTMLAGNLSRLGSANDGVTDTLHFLFDNLSGDAAGLFGGSAGIILAGTGFGGNTPADFAGNFSNGGPFGSADTATPAVPEPGVLALLVAGGLLLMGGRRRIITKA